LVVQAVLATMFTHPNVFGEIHLLGKKDGRKAKRQRQEGQNGDPLDIREGWQLSNRVMG